jgi:hypothetical protein
LKLEEWHFARGDSGAIGKGVIYAPSFWFVFLVRKFMMKKNIYKSRSFQPYILNKPPEFAKKKATPCNSEEHGFWLTEGQLERF